MPMRDNLVAHWSLEEASGTRADDIGSNTLTDNNTTTGNPGKLGNAAQFTAANSESLSIATNAALQMGDIDFTFAVWVYLDSKTTRRHILSRTLVALEYILEYFQSSDVFRFGVSSDGSAFTVITASTFGSPATGTWYLLMGWHDSVANTLNIQVNNGTVNSVSYSAGVLAGTSATYLGSNGGLSFFMDGRLDEAAVWKRVLTTQERTDLYNGGAGLAYSAFSGTYTLSGSATPAVATGSGTGLTFAPLRTLSGSATPGAATGSGAGLAFTPFFTLSGSAQAAAATGSGPGLTFTDRPGNIVALTLAPRIRALTLGDRS